MRAARRLRDYIELKQRRSIGSQLIEDCFNVIKRKSDAKSNTTCTTSFAHSVLVDEGVVTSKHRYTDVERRHEIIERGAALPAHANRPVLHKAMLDPCVKEVDFSQIAGFGDADWWSPGASGYMSPYADLEASRQAAASGQLHLLGNKLFSRLINHDMLVRRHGEDRWWLGLGAIDSAIAVLWPMDENSGGMFTVSTAPTATRRLVTVLNFDDWEARSIKWLGPMHRAIMRGLEGEPIANIGQRNVKLKPGSSYADNAVCACPSSPSMSLLKVAAHEAFWSLPGSYLKELGERLEAHISGTSLIDIVTSMVRFALPELSDDLLIRILDKRSLWYEKESCYVEDLTSLEWATELLDRSFSEVLATEIKDGKAMQSAHEEFASDLVKLKVPISSKPFCSQGFVRERGGARLSPPGWPFGLSCVFSCRHARPFVFFPMPPQNIATWFAPCASQHLCPWVSVLSYMVRPSAFDCISSLCKSAFGAAESLYL